MRMILTRAMLMISLACAYPVAAKGADCEALNVASAPKLLKALVDVSKIKGEENQDVPGVGTIITKLGDKWEGELDQPPEKNVFMFPNPQVCKIPAASENDGEKYMGKKRAMAKTQIANAPLDPANLTVKGFHTCHPPDAEMQNMDISTNCDSERVEAEQRNVTVVAYLIAATKESDNDYHFILQDRDCDSPGCRLTVEVVGIPNVTTDRDKLAAVRQKFEHDWEEYTGRKTPKAGSDFIFFITPLLVKVTGSAFYDKHHKLKAGEETGEVGPKGFKTGSAWEIHPVTQFEFAPES